MRALLKKDEGYITTQRLNIRNLTRLTFEHLVAAYESDKLASGRESPWVTWTDHNAITYI